VQITADFEGCSDELLLRLARTLLSAVVDYNRVLLRSYPFPQLYRSGVRFRDEPWAGELVTPDGRRVKGIEQLAHAQQVIDRGWGDCAQLCSWRIAELENMGEPFGTGPHTPFHFSLRPIPTDDGTMRSVHVMIDRVGWVEDPSRILL
jgi:hypothetical protein